MKEKMKDIHIQVDEKTYARIKGIFPHHGGMALTIRTAIAEFLEHVNTEKENERKNNGKNNTTFGI